MKSFLRTLFTACVLLASASALQAQTLSIGDFSIIEGNSSTTADLSFFVTLSSAATQTVSVEYATSDQTAKASSDYIETTGTLTIAPGSRTGLIRVPIIQDSVFESQETFLVTLFNASGATIADDTGIGTIQNDDTAPNGLTLSVRNAATQYEGGPSAPGKNIFAISVSPSPLVTVSVHYQTVGNTAKAGTDFKAVSGTLSFAPGETTRYVRVNFIGDTSAELNETFFLDLDSATNAGIADSRGSAFIRNDDGPRISIDNARTVDEGNAGTTTQTFRVHLSQASNDTITVNWATANNTAGPVDYVVDSGTLTFAPGQISKNIVIQIKGDTTVESTETYRVNLSRPVYGALADSQGIGYIRNDDGGAASTAIVNEPSQ